MYLVIRSPLQALLYRAVLSSFFSFLLVGVLADSVLELLDTFRHTDYLFLKSHFLGLEVSELLVKTDGLGAHDAVMSRDVLLDAMELVGQSLASVLALHGEDVLECFLLTAEDLHLFLMNVQILMERAARLGQAGELALKVRRVLAALHLAHGSLCNRNMR